MSHGSSKWKLGKSESFAQRTFVESRDAVPKGVPPSASVGAHNKPNATFTSATGKTHQRFGSSNTFLHHEESSQTALFEDGNLWEAAFEGDLEKVKTFSVEPYHFPPLPHPDAKVMGRRGDCERGGEGETILHIAVLGRHKEMVKWIVRTFPNLVNEVYLKRKYFGETALHIAVVNSVIGDTELVTFLIENGAKVNGPLVTGTEFLKDEDKGCLYYGQTILQFAASTHKNKVLKYLVENPYDPADLSAVDIYGNNVLHVMAYYGDFEIEVFNYIKHRNMAQLEEARKTGVPCVDLMRARNKDNLTPFQLGISRGHANMIDTIKELEWEFGSVRHYRICIDDLDPIQPHQEKIDTKTGEVLSSSRVSKSAIEIAADREDKAIINHPLFESLLNVKWALYARKKFLIRFVLTLLLMIIFTVTIGLQPFTLADRRNYFNGGYDGNKYPIVRLAFEGLSVLGVLGMLLGEAKEFATQGFAYFVGYGAGENIIQWSVSTLVLLIPIFRWGVASAVNQSQWFYVTNTENIIFAFAIILGWVYMLNFSKGFKSVGPLIVVYKKILVTDLMQWLALYIALTLGFAAALFLQMRDVPNITQNEPIVVLDWTNYLGSVLWTIRFLFAQTVFDDFRKSKLAGFTEFLFFLYGFLVMVLLINVLIAKLVETFKEVAKDSKRYWAVQFAYLIIDTDEKLNDSTRHFLLRHVGWHANPIEQGSIIQPRYFLFTERDVPDPENPGHTISQTMKLVVARTHSGEDIEIRTGMDYWNGWVKDLVKPFEKMKREHDREMRNKKLTQASNLWHDHSWLVKTNETTKYQIVNDRRRQELCDKKDS
ncbi:ankyrin [Rhizoclosmatium globosum]|uniref:Ankyrin n=1 Tax=Rhizoclosmatium globosum TaxID=329046 RepID=A0A1Y2C8A8_9FUNG|nr:ankyrin [Rhizoclosmatium globosum]|eukprot:ORY43269.1 ankyrin [Rhizoclosmatium globosum]